MARKEKKAKPVKKPAAPKKAEVQVTPRFKSKYMKDIDKK